MKDAAGDRRHAEHVEEPRRYLGTLEALWSGATRQVEDVFAIGGQMREGAGVVLQVEEVRRGMVVPRALRGGAPDAHDAIGIGVGKRPKQDAVDDTEDRAVRADPERQRRDGDDGEAGILDQDSNRVAQIGPERIESSSQRGPPVARLRPSAFPEYSNICVVRSIG